MKEKEPRTPEQLVDDIQQACKQLGWDIAMDVSSEEISGLIVGQHDYIQEVLSGSCDEDNYEIYGYSKDNQQ